MFFLPFSFKALTQPAPAGFNRLFSLFITVKMPPPRTAFCFCTRNSRESRPRPLLAFFLFASLVGNSATGFASRLAGSLAFSAAALFGTFAQIAGFHSVNVFHHWSLPEYWIEVIIAYNFPLVNKTGENFPGSRFVFLLYHRIGQNRSDISRVIFTNFSFAP